jgi:hypothetical protein
MYANRFSQNALLPDVTRFMIADTRRDDEKPRGLFIIERFESGVLPRPCFAPPFLLEDT